MKKAKRISHAPPSKASLREMPEADFTKPGWRRGSHLAARIREEGLTFQIDGEAPIVLREGAGRPKNGEGVGASRPHSVRLPDAVWRQLEARARREGTTAHALLRAAIAGFLRTG
jgi:hypothetical protein